MQKLYSIGEHFTDPIFTVIDKMRKSPLLAADWLKAKVLNPFYNNLSAENKNDLNRARQCTASAYFRMQRAMYSILSTYTTIKVATNALLIFAGISAYAMVLLIFLWRVLLQIGRMQYLGSSILDLFENTRNSSIELSSHWADLNATLHYFSLDSEYLRTSAIAAGLQTCEYVFDRHVCLLQTMQITYNCHNKDAHL